MSKNSTIVIQFHTECHIAKLESLMICEPFSFAPGVDSITCVPTEHDRKYPWLKDLSNNISSEQQGKTISAGGRTNQQIGVLVKVKCSLVRGVATPVRHVRVIFWLVPASVHKRQVSPKHSGYSLKGQYAAVQLLQNFSKAPKHRALSNGSDQLAKHLS